MRIEPFNDTSDRNRTDYLLIVDDKPNNRLLLNTYLTSAGYTVQMARTGEEALARIEAKPPSLVLLDIRLPGLNGYEVCRRIKTSEKISFIPVILITAVEEEEERLKGIESGADDFISRPIHKLELLTRVKSLLRIKRLHEELEAKNIQLQQMAITDGLTGLYNYSYFRKILRQEVLRSLRYGQPVSLLMMDIDFFKMYNDQFGHLKGDQILRQFALLLCKNIRQTDFLARYGGEEFALILPSTDKESAHIVGEKLRKLVENAKFPLSEKLPFGRVTISIGVANVPQDVKEDERLIQLADQALYRAKREGRNRTILA